MTSTTATSTTTVARALTRRARPLLAVAFWIGVWHIAAAVIGQDFLLASPVKVAHRLGELVVTGDFWKTVGTSLGRIGIGFVAAAVVGSAVAAIAATSRAADALARPLMAAIRSAPVVSFIIIVLLWTDSGKLAAITSFLMVLPVMYTNVLEGIRNRDRSLVEAASVFGVPSIRRVRAIDAPAVLPFFTAACHTGIGLAWKSGVAAEVIGVASGSIGERMYQAKLFLSSEDLFAWTVVVVALSVACEWCVLRVVSQVARRLAGSFS